MSTPFSGKQKLGILFMFLLVSSWTAIPASGEQQTPTGIGLELPDFPTIFDYEITLIFLGINETRVDEASLIERLPAWYGPVDGMFWSSEYDEAFNIDYNILFADLESVIEFRTFIEEYSVEDRAPSYLQPEHPRARYISSSEAENYLTSEVSSENTATLIIIDTYTQNPAEHIPYYYNSTFNELDAELQGFTSTPIPWCSTYQIAGGGEDSRLLWLDLSAGPTVYHGFGASPAGGVEYIKPIWEYEFLDDPNAALEDDLVEYITHAVEMRFIPSIGTKAGLAYEEVKLDVLLVDIADTTFQFEEMLNCEYIISEYKRVLPMIEWTYSVTECDWQADSSFSTAMNDAMNEDDMIFDPGVILRYLDANYASFTEETTKDKLVIPIFLFLMPEGWTSYPDWGGFAKLMAGEFAYIYGKQGLESVNPEYAAQQVMSILNLEIENNTYFITGGNLGTQRTRISASLTVHDGAVSVYTLDEYGFNQYNNSLPFADLLAEPLSDITNASGNVVSKMEMRILGNYYLVIENNGDTNATIDLEVEMTFDNFVGYTWKIMHEIGHALGLNHPHEGYSYANYDHPDTSAGIYLDWLWDMSYSQISYANQAPTISQMDLDTLQREIVPRIWNDSVFKFNEIVTGAEESLGDIPDDVLDRLIIAADLFNRSVEYYEDSSNLNNYNQSLRAAFEMWTALKTASILLNANLNEILFGALGISMGIVLVITVPVVFSLKKRRIAK
ncbi:MAG: M66 family metalloprotease [Candidatus Thorarchaeota archaeon]